MLNQPDAWAAPYVGLPFEEGGRDVSGVDCYGLIHLIYARELNIHLPRLETDYSGTDDAAGMEAASLMRHDSPWSSVAVGALKNFDVLFFRPVKAPIHVGLFVQGLVHGLAANSGFMLHVEKDMATTCVVLDTSIWKTRLRACYRHEARYFHEESL